MGTLAVIPVPVSLSVVLVLAGSYLVGAVPFGVLLSRIVAGVDPRRAGSGNVGATNVARLVGRRWFPVVFVLDAAKGLVPPLFLAPLAAVGGERALLLAAGCGAAAVLGHVFDVFLGFRGGKGVATACGAVLALAPIALLCALAAFVLTVLLTRFVSLASVVAATALPVAAWALDSPRVVVGFCTALTAVILIRHRGNIARIARGAEPRISLAGRAVDPGGEQRSSP